MVDAHTHTQIVLDLVDPTTVLHGILPLLKPGAPLVAYLPKYVNVCVGCASSLYCYYYDYLLNIMDF